MDDGFLIWITEIRLIHFPEKFDNAGFDEKWKKLSKYISNGGVQKG